MAFRIATVLFAFSLVMPLLPVASARAETEKGDKGGTHQEDGDHHETGDGQNNDGNSPGTTNTTATTVNSTTNTAGGTDILHRRYGEIVASPVLDTAQTKAAIAAGKAASMPLLLTYLSQNYPGQVLDVKLHNITSGYVYEVRYLANVIVLRTLFLDAATLKAQ